MCEYFRKSNETKILNSRRQSIEIFLFIGKFRIKNKTELKTNNKMLSCMYFYAYMYTQKKLTCVKKQTLHNCQAAEESCLENNFLGNIEKMKSRIIFLNLRENK